MHGIGSPRTYVASDSRRPGCFETRLAQDKDVDAGEIDFPISLPDPPLWCSPLVKG